MRPICFSATASFTVGVALVGVGAFTLRRARTAERPYAAIPVIFGLQQFVEGALWLALRGEAPAGAEAASHSLTVAYLLFANVLWPAWVPAAVWLIEPSAARRKAILLALAVGAATGLYYLAAIVTRPVSAAIEGAHISYVLPHAHQELAFAFYAAATCLAPLFSSYRTVRLLGAVIVAAMVLAYLAYEMWFASAWCFFAAAASVVVLLHFWGKRPGGAAPG